MRPTVGFSLPASLAQVVLFAARHSAPSVHAANATLQPSLSRWLTGLHLGVDYYPSQWPQSVWDADVAEMQAANLSYVRVNEFDWAMIEPTDGVYNFTLLDDTLALLARHGLKAIIGTPTASPPDWVMQNYKVAFKDVTNQTLGFGSRRHYSLSSFDYRMLSRRITTALAQRYGTHPAVAGWQLDNEFGCHSTTRSYDDDAITRFRTWLQTKYGTVEAMNRLQGRVFWSQQWASFDAVAPPFLEVYTTNEAHTLDWYTFSSDMVAEFAAEQAAILREHAPTHAITTNMQMAFLDFDHHAFARAVGLDFATFDVYPLSGPGQFGWLDDAQLAATLRTGLPDYAALHHALYRGVAGGAYEDDGDSNTTTRGPFGVMEMQPGVLNWETYRVSPWPGMVRLWTLETLAAGGDFVSYFRWRQAAFAQEQTLSGLHLPDGTVDEGLDEVHRVGGEDLPVLQEYLTGTGEEDEEDVADVALVFDYTSSWVWDIEPYSGSWDVQSASYADPAVTYFDLVYLFFSALRRLGLSVDVISPLQPVAGYKMLVVPSLPILPPAFADALASFTGPVVFGPHSGTKDAHFANNPAIVDDDGSNARDAEIARRIIPARVVRVETPPTYADSGVVYNGVNYTIWAREEWLVCAAGNGTTALVVYTSPHRRPGSQAVCERDGVHYIGFRASASDFLVAYLADVAAGAGIVDVLGRMPTNGTDLGESLRVLKRGKVVFAMNYGVDPVDLPAGVLVGKVLLGTEGATLEGAGVTAWVV